MSNPAISRAYADAGSVLGQAVTVPNALPSTPTKDQQIRFSEYSGGEIYVPTGSPITSLTFYVAPKFDGTYVAAYDSSSMAAPAAIVLTVAAARAYPIPADLFGAGAILMVGNAAGTVYVTLKG